MGKGDKKTKRGKIIQGSYGVKRKRDANKSKAFTPDIALKADLKAKKEIEAEKTLVEESGKPVGTDVAKAKPVKKKAAPKAVKKEMESAEETAPPAGE